MRHDAFKTNFVHNIKMHFFTNFVCKKINEPIIHLYILKRYWLLEYHLLFGILQNMFLFLICQVSKSSHLYKYFYIFYKFFESFLPQLTNTLMTCNMICMQLFGVWQIPIYVYVLKFHWPPVDIFTHCNYSISFSCLTAWSMRFMALRLLMYISTR